jgi:hypothetical protein
VLDGWHYYHNHCWSGIPAWCKAYGKLGKTISDYQNSNRRLVIGLAVPTRAYVAAFVALGLILERSTLSDQTDPEVHFRNLCEAKPGTAVWYKEGERQKKAVLEGCEERYGRLYLALRLNCNHEEHLLPSALAINVQLSDKEIVRLPKHQKGRLIPSEDTLLGACLNGVSVFDYCTTSRLDGVFIGNKKQLCHEFEMTPFAVRSEGESFAQGRLQDILRVRELLGEGEGCRTSLISDRTKPNSVMAAGETPPLMLFDGAPGFLKWRDYWRGSHWLIVLDKTESGFYEAVAALNQEYRNNHINGAPLELLRRVQSILGSGNDCWGILKPLTWLFCGVAARKVDPVRSFAGCFKVEGG